MSPGAHFPTQLHRGSASILALVLEPRQRQRACADGPHKGRAAAEEGRPEVSGAWASSLGPPVVTDKHSEPESLKQVGSGTVLPGRIARSV